MSPANWCAYGASSAGRGGRDIGATSASSNISAPIAAASPTCCQREPRRCRDGPIASSQASISGPIARRRRSTRLPRRSRAGCAPLWEAPPSERAQDERPAWPRRPRAARIDAATRRIMDRARRDARASDALLQLVAQRQRLGQLLLRLVGIAVRRSRRSSCRWRRRSGRAAPGRRRSACRSNTRPLVGFGFSSTFRSSASAFLPCRPKVEPSTTSSLVAGLRARSASTVTSGWRRSASSTSVWARVLVVASGSYGYGSIRLATLRTRRPSESRIVVAMRSNSA